MEKLLVLRASDGKILAQDRSDSDCIKAVNDDINQWCLFKLENP
jgi:hypothetical protein